jgi:hypothetical protein
VGPEGVSALAYILTGTLEFESRIVVVAQVNGGGVVVSTLKILVLQVPGMLVAHPEKP